MNVLLADDEITITVTLSDDLSDAGHSVTVCRDGVSAWDAFQRGRYDVVISDVRMPGRTGIELVQLIKERAPATVVILITGFGDLEIAEEARAAGADELVRKPFLNDDMVARLEQLRP